MAKKANQAMIDRMGKERGSRNFTYLKLSKDIASGKSETYRILPVPDDGRSYGFGRYVSEFWFDNKFVPKKFRAEGQEKTRFFDPNGCFNKRTCALTNRLFEDYKALKAESAKEKVLENARNMLPQRYRLIVAAKRSEIDKQGKAAPIYVLSIPIKTYDAIEMRMKKHDLTSPTDGSDIEITRMGSGRDGTTYEVDVQEACPLAEDKDVRIALRKKAAEINLDDLLTDDSAALDAVYKIMFNEEPVGEDEEKPAKKGKKSSKPKDDEEDEEDADEEDSEDEDDVETDPDEDEDDADEVEAAAKPKKGGKAPAKKTGKRR
jgi:hypothetical protein